MDGRTRSLLRPLSWLAGLVLLSLVVRRVGWRSVVDTLTQVGPRILWLAGVYAAGNLLLGLPWRLLFSPDRRPGVAASVLSRLAAAGLNAVLPLLTLGEGSRLLWLRRSDWPDGLAAILVDRL